MIKPIWRNTYKIRWNDIDYRGKASLISIANFLQETAWQHARHLGLGYNPALKTDLLWVIVGMKIEMSSYRGIPNHFVL